MADLNSHEEKITIHFTHGSIRKPGAAEVFHRKGGLLGGHVEVEIDGYVYGFDHRNPSVHFLPRPFRRFYNSQFTRKPFADWQTEVKDQKITSIEVPVSASQKDRLLDIYSRYMKKAPYDYAVLGMRCTASAYTLLATIGLLPRKTKLKMWLSTLVPQMLRKRMMHLANENHYTVSRKPGTTLKIWE